MTMRRRTAVLACAAVLAGAACAGELANRWVYLNDSLLAKDCVERVSNVVATAKAGGMNGVVFGCGVEFCRYWGKDRHERLARIKAACDAMDMEIIPTMWALGYAALRNYDRNIVEGIAVEGVPYRVEGTNAVFDAASAPVTAVDVKTCCCQRTNVYCRFIKKAKVKPHRRYRYAFEFRTKDLAGDKPFKVIALDGSRSTYFEKESCVVDYRPTQDWTPYEMSFCSAESDLYYLYIGFMSGWKGGLIDVRNITLSEIGPGQVLHRPGAPMTLRNAETGQVYEEGRDYTAPKMGLSLTSHDMPPLALALPPGSRVKAGDRLTFDSYTPAIVNGQQASSCLSEPSLYGYLEDSAARIEAALHPKKWHLSMDEFRNGGTCAACRARGMTMGQIYADAVTKAFNIVRKAHPGAEVYIWSDMLDPDHNGVKEYFNCATSFEDAWKGVPKDLVICCWYGKKCETSMKFFSEKGFRTFAAAYYDEKPPFPVSRRWRDTVRRTPGAVGIMYTTWRSAFGDLPAFCDMLKEE